MGIGKKELLNDYYMDEFEKIAGEWAVIHGKKEEQIEEELCTDPMAFLMGG